jgi:CDP-ribitol ribitolphosphotransferase
MNWLEYVLSTTVLRICSVLFSLFPLRRDKVVFASARSERLRGNMRFIHAKMKRSWPEADYRFILRRYSYGLFGKLRYMVSLIGAQYQLATARLFIVDNAFLPIHIRPHRSATTVVQVWHAAGALKRFGVDVSPDERKIESRFLHKYYDWVVVGSRDAVGPYASALRTPQDRVVPLGIARTDFFFDSKAMAKQRDLFFERYPSLSDKKIVLYAPTFRGHGRHKHLIDALDATALKSRLPSGWALAYKTHPVMGGAAFDVEGFDVVIDSQLGINGVFTAVDVLVTDYSAAIFEYALLRKPLILFAPDLDRYRDDPGFYLDYPDDVIGEFAQTTGEVGDILERNEYDLSGYDEFITRYMEMADGGASDRFVEFVRDRGVL